MTANQQRIKMMIFDAYDTKTQKRVATLEAQDLETAIRVAKNQARLFEFREMNLDPDALFVCASPSDQRSKEVSRYGFQWHIA